MSARTLPTLPNFPATSELTSTQLNQLAAYQSFWANPPAFRAEQHAAQNVTNATNTQITCETTIHDSDSGLSPSSPYTYVVPFAGIWDFSGGVSQASNTTGLRIPMIYQNGAAVNGAAPGYVPGASLMLYNTLAPGITCNVGDTIALYLYQSSGSTLATSGASATSGQYSWFSGHLVSLASP